MVRPPWCKLAQADSSRMSEAHPGARLLKSPEVILDVKFRFECTISTGAADVLRPFRSCGCQSHESLSYRSWRHRQEGTADPRLRLSEAVGLSTIALSDFNSPTITSITSIKSAAMT